LGFVNHAGMNSKADSVDKEQIEAEQQNAFMSKHISALSIVKTFLERLTCTSREGKVIIEWPGDSASNAGGNAMFRFVQIHSASLLDSMVEEAHAIILAGGTLRYVQM
jgi:Rad3-related DNA helicase